MLIFPITNLNCIELLIVLRSLILRVVIFSPKLVMEVRAPCNINFLQSDRLDTRAFLAFKRAGWKESDCRDKNEMDMCC